MMVVREQHQARSAARRKALQILFQCEVTGDSLDEVLASGLYIDEVGVPCEFTKLLLHGVHDNSETIDKLIIQTSENWSLDRMPLVDRSILRVATFEMLYVEDVPYSVSINEAVELAKCFGGEDESSRFVNGILGRIAGYLNDQISEGQFVGKKVQSKREKKAVHG